MASSPALAPVAGSSAVRSHSVFATSSSPAAAGSRRRTALRLVPPASLSRSTEMYTAPSAPAEMPSASGVPVPSGKREGLPPVGQPSDCTQVPSSARTRRDTCPASLLEAHRICWPSSRICRSRPERSSAHSPAWSVTRASPVVGNGAAGSGWTQSLAAPGVAVAWAAYSPSHSPRLGATCSVQLTVLISAPSGANRRAESAPPRPKPSWSPVTSRCAPGAITVPAGIVYVWVSSSSLIAKPPASTGSVPSLRISTKSSPWERTSLITRAAAQLLAVPWVAAALSWKSPVPSGHRARDGVAWVPAGQAARSTRVPSGRKRRA